jgi:hypothetical protein
VAKGKVIQRVIELKDKFSPGLKKVQKGTLQFKKDVKELKKVGSAAFKGIAVGIAATGAAAVGAGVGFTVLASKFASTADEIDKTSMKLGVTTDAYQELKFAMGQVGVTQSNFEKGLGRLNQRLADTETNEKYRTAIQNLGIATEDATGKTRNADEVFMETVQALHEMENSTDRAAKAQEIFGTRTARELLPAIEAGGESIEKLRNEAHELGAVISEDGVKAGVLWADSMDKLKKAAGGMMDTFAASTIPHFNKGIQWLIDKIPIVKQVATDSFNAMKQAIEDNREKIGAIKGVFIDVKNGIAGAFGSNGEGGGAINWFVGTGIPAIVGGVASVLNGIATTYKFFRDNWSLISPVIYGIVGALTAYHVITKAILIRKYALTAAQWAWNAAMNANPIGMVVMGIGALIAAGVFLIKNWDDVKLAGQKTWNGIVSGVEWGVNAYIDYINFLIDNALKGVNFLIDQINKVPGIDIGSVSFDKFGNLDFGAAKFDTEGKEFQWGNKKQKEESFEDVLSNYGKSREFKIQEQKASQDTLVASLDENTKTMKETRGGGNNFNITVNATDLTAEEIADKLVPRIERKLCGA